MAYSTNTRGSARRRRNSSRSQTSNSSSQGRSSFKKPSKKQINQVNPQGVKKHLGKNFRIKGAVYSPEANQKDLRITFWRGELGPRLLIDNLNNVRSRDWTNEFRNDLTQIRENRQIFGRDAQDPVDAIYIVKPDTHQDDLVTTIQNIANDEAPQGKHYRQLSDENGNVIQLQLVEGQPPAPTPRIPIPRRNLTPRNQPARTPSTRNLIARNRPVAQRNLTLRNQLPRNPVSELINQISFIEPEHAVSSRDVFIRAMGKAPDPSDKENRYTKIIQALDKYHAAVTGQKKKINREGRAEITDAEFTAANNVIQKRKDLLGLALSDYLGNSTSAFVKKKSLLGKAVRTLRGDNDQRLTAVKRLQKEIENANSKGVNEELEVFRDNDSLKRKFILTKYRPLRDSDISREGEILGKGAQGFVKSKIYDISKRQGFPDDLPNSGEIEVGVKFNSRDLVNQEAADAGIPKTHSGEAIRSVATYKVSRWLRLNVVPFTTFIYGKNAKTKKEEFGHAMLRVHGTDGQQSVRIDKLSQQEAKQYLDDPNIEVPENIEVDRVKGEVWRTQKWPVKVPLETPVIQKELADLQILDNVVGHADRHPGNWRFKVNGSGKIIGVRGIDNDDTFGRSWIKRNFGSGKPGSKTPGIPPYIDVYTAISVLKAFPNDLYTLNYELTNEEYTAAVSRLTDVQNAIKERIRNGKLAIMPNAQPPNDGDLTFLAEQANLDSKSLQTLKIKKWGQETYGVHRPIPKLEDSDPDPSRNSYLGEMIFLGQQLGLVNPDYK